MTEILLIKLGALGDVLRTTSLLAGIRKRWPDAKITWITNEAARPLLAKNPDISLIETPETFNSGPAAATNGRTWDVLINLDEELSATNIAGSAGAKQKFGVGRNAAGRLIPLAPESEILVRLATDDRLKFRDNQLSFQSRIYQAAGLTWQGESYRYFPPSDMDTRRATLMPKLNLPPRAGAKAIHTGMFVGASDRYANKFWSEDEIDVFCGLYLRTSEECSGGGIRPLFLFGGPAEEQRLKRLRERTAARGAPRISVGTLDDLAALVSLCAVLICGDTLVMHLAQAMNIPSVVLFGPTAQAEIIIEGRKIVSPYSCGPCYLRKCDITPSCMSAIRPERVLQAVQSLS